MLRIRLEGHGRRVGEVGEGVAADRRRQDLHLVRLEGGRDRQLRGFVLKRRTYSKYKKSTMATVLASYQQPRVRFSERISVNINRRHYCLESR